MKSPALPENEQARQQALDDLAILDTPAEERFDRLTRLAKRLFNVPIALVSLVDRNRQWFKSCFGLPVRETARSISFCGHAILDDKVLVVNDATQDPRFFDNPLVVDEPKKRFYAGCPILSDSGYKLGTFCIIDQAPRQFSADDLATLVDLAMLAQREISAVQLATLDELTLISNRRGFMLLGNKALQSAARQQNLLTLLFIDLNDFKQINDQYGHAEGDKALTVFSALLEQNFRQSDTLARIGGDEFAVIQSVNSVKDAFVAVNRLRADLKQYNEESGNEYRIDFSEGVIAVAPDNELSLDELLKKADFAMYENKKRKKTG